MSAASNARPTIALTVATVLCFSCSLLVLNKIATSERGKLIQESLYINSPSALKRMSLGYSGLLADIYWTRAVQYFGNHHVRRADEYNLLYPLLDITTELDPKLIVAYRFGAIFLSEAPPEGAGQPQKAVELVEKGIRNHPDDWRLYYDLGFLQAWNLHDYLAASKTFAAGSAVPNSNPVLKALAASYAERGGDIATSVLLWKTTYETTENDMIRKNAMQHLQSIQSDREVTSLEDIVGNYRQRTGHDPKSFSDLISAGLLRGVPVDPTGRPFQLLPGGKIQVQDPDALPFLTKGAPPDWTPKVSLPKK